jgi:hypothetical protein
MVRPLIHPWSVSGMNEGYDLFLTALGFERRARSIAEDLSLQAKMAIACAFPDRKMLCYEQNYRWFDENGFHIHEVHDSEFENWFSILLGNLDFPEGAEASVAIDISSITRYRMAVVVDLLRRSGKSIRCDFMYRIAEFTPPLDEPGPNVHVGPVCDAFAGWSVEPEKPPVAVIGLGYEENRALGVLEHIQASEAWLFRPKSSIEEYDLALTAANSSLLENSPLDKLFDYRVENPFDCFVVLELVLGRLRQSASPLIFPFGPKIFALCALLVGTLYDDVAVWRVSAGPFERAVNRLPTSVTCGIRVEFPGNGGEVDAEPNP